MTALRIILSVVALATLLVLQCEARPDRRGPPRRSEGSPLDGPLREGPPRDDRRGGPPRDEHREDAPGERRPPPRHHRRGCLPLACSDDSDCPSNRTTCVEVELNFDNITSRGLCLKNKVEEEERVDAGEEMERGDHDVAEHLAKSLMKMACSDGEHERKCPEKSEGCTVGPFVLDFNNTKTELMFCQKPNVTINSGEDLFAGCPRRRPHHHSSEKEDGDANTDGPFAADDDEFDDISREEFDVSSEESAEFEPNRREAPPKQGRVGFGASGSLLRGGRRGRRSAESHKKREGKRGSKHVCRIEDSETEALLEDKACENDATCSDTPSLLNVNLDGKPADIFFCERPEEHDDRREEEATDDEQEQLEELMKYAKSLMSGACQVLLNETTLKKNVSCEDPADECDKGPATLTVGSNTFTLTLCPNQEAEDLGLFWTESFNSCLKGEKKRGDDERRPGGKRAKKFGKERVGSDKKGRRDRKF